MVETLKLWLQQQLEEIVARVRMNPETGIGTTSDPRKEMLQVIMIAGAFLGAQWQAMLAVVTVGFLALRTRDWMISPAKGTVLEATTDCTVMGLAIFASQLFFLNARTVFAVDYPPILIRGIGLSMPLVFFVRMLFHLNTPANDPEKEPDFRLYRVTLRINLMWWLSGGFVVGSCVQAVPGSHTRDQILGLLYVVPAQILMRLVMDPERIDWIFLDLKSDPAIKELQGRVDRLIRWGAIKDVQFPRATVYVAMVLALSVFSASGIALFRLFTGQGANVNWLQILVSDAGIIALALILMVIMQVNETVAEILNMAIEQRKQKQQSLIGQ